MWLFLVTQYNSSLSSFVPNFRFLSQVVAEKSLTDKSSSLERGKLTNKGTDKQYVQLITIKLCTKFQKPKSSSCWEIFDRKKSLQTNRQTNKHNYRKGKNYIPLYTSYRGINIFQH